MWLFWCQRIGKLAEVVPVVTDEWKGVLMPKAKRKGGLARSLVAIVLSAIAAKLAMKAVEQIWTKGLHKSVPDVDEESSLGNKMAWMGITAAVVGMAREIVRELTAPVTAEDSAE
jgi:hypothetical protein